MKEYLKDEFDRMLAEEEEACEKSKRVEIKPELLMFANKDEYRKYNKEHGNEIDETKPVIVNDNGIIFVHRKN